VAWIGLALGVCILFAPAPVRAEVDPDAPVPGPPVPGAIPPLPVSGALVEAAPAQTGSQWVHEGRFSRFGDLAATPAVTAACPSLLPGPAATTVSAELPARLADAHDEAALSVGQLDGGTIQDFFHVFESAVEALGGDVQVAIGDTQPACVGYPAVHARWLRRQWRPRPLALGAQGEKLHVYHPRPRPFDEARLRGARLYCAAREAQFQQGGSVASMGERVGFSVKVLGKTIDFLVVEPTLALDGPERFTAGGANDGAQAFEVPLLFGTRITPIRGLGLPGFREVRVPVSLVTADSEIRTGAELRPVHVGSTLQCGFETGPPFGCKLVPEFVTQHAKEYHTVSHLDAIRSAHKQSSISGQTEILRVGPLAVSIGFTIDWLLGALDVDPGRVLALPGLGLPPARSGRLWVNPLTAFRLHDGAWGLRFETPAPSAPPGSLSWNVLPDGETDPFWRDSLPLLFPPPLQIRLLQNDDHAVLSSTGLGIEGTLSGVLGKDFGPFEVTLQVTGALDGEVVQHHRLRDALLAQDQGGPSMTAVTGLGVLPRQTADAELKPATGRLRLFLALPWPLDDIDIQKTLFTAPLVKLADYDSDDALGATDEALNFRLGAGSRRGSVMEKPVVFSHFPGRPEFPSFPVDVDGCLADPAPNPPPPPPCEPATDPGAVPAAEVCLYGPGPGLRPLLGNLPPNVCSGVPGFVATLGLPPDQSQCLQDFLAFLCAPVSKQQPFTGPPSVVAHVLDLLDPAQGEQLAAVLEACAAAFGAVGPDGTVDSSAVAEDFVSVGVCDALGNLLPDGDVLGAVGSPTTPPPAQAGPACS
jgi:hypothetical protein